MSGNEEGAEAIRKRAAGVVDRLLRRFGIDDLPEESRRLCEDEVENAILGRERKPSAFSTAMDRIVKDLGYEGDWDTHFQRARRLSRPSPDLRDARRIVRDEIEALSVSAREVNRSDKKSKLEARIARLQVALDSMSFEDDSDLDEPGFEEFLVQNGLGASLSIEKMDALHDAISRLEEIEEDPASFVFDDPRHPDEIAVATFASRMKVKLAVAREKGRRGWQDKSGCTAYDLSWMLREHVEKGDPVDVANFAMMLSQRGESIVKLEPSPERIEQLVAEVLADEDSDGMVSDEISGSKIVEEVFVRGAFSVAVLPYTS